MLPLMSLVPTPPLSTFTLRSTFLHHLLLLCSHSMYNTCEFFTPMPQNNQPVLSCSDPCNIDTPPPTHYFLSKFANPRHVIVIETFPLPIHPQCPRYIQPQVEVLGHYFLIYSQ